PQQLQINAERLARSEVLAAMANRMRASFLLMGPLLARRGEARVAKPGGDDIGMRRVEQHLVGLRLMGASVELEGGEYVARADRLKGATIHLDMPTVTGTENLMMAAATADGITTIHNAAREPHVVDLAMFLGKMGARIHGIGTDVLEIEGVPELSGATHRVIPDNIEAGTYAFAIAATGGAGVVEDVETADLRALILKLRCAGGGGGRATRSGRRALDGGWVAVPDVRAGAALVLAARCAEGTAVFGNIYPLDRGYREIVGKLGGLGGDITRVEGEGEVRHDL